MAINESAAVAMSIDIHISSQMILRIESARASVLAAEKVTHSRSRRRVTNIRVRERAIASTATTAR